MRKIHWFSEAEPHVENAVNLILENGVGSCGNIRLTYIPEDNLYDYNWDNDEEEFIKEHEDCEFFTVDYCVYFEQQINLIAVEE